MLGYDTQAQVRKELGFNIFDQIYANLKAADERITNARETMAQNMSSQGFGITSEGIEVIEGRFAERFNDTEVRGMLDNIT